MLAEDLHEKNLRAKVLAPLCSKVTNKTPCLSQVNKSNHSDGKLAASRFTSLQAELLVKNTLSNSLHTNPSITSETFTDLFAKFYIDGKTTFILCT